VTVTNYIWDVENDTCLMETDENGETKVLYSHEPTQFGGLISQRRDGQTYYHHYDALGSTRQLTDADENVTDEYVYTAWGEPVVTNGTTENPFRWVGRWGYYWDEATGTYYIRRRDYQPTIAQWLSADPKELHDGLSAPFALTPYEYGALSPLVMIDPWGLDAEDCCGANVGDCLRKALLEVERAFDDLSEYKRFRVCESMVHPKGWDINEFWSAGGGKDGTGEYVFGKGACGSGKCIGSITIDGHCYWAAEVNYVLWGLLRKKCDKFYESKATRLYDVVVGGDVHIAHYALPWRRDRRVITIKDTIEYMEEWRRWKYSERESEDPLSEPPRRSPGMGIPGRKAWIGAGWDGDWSDAVLANVDKRCPPCDPSIVYEGWLTVFVGAEEWHWMAPLQPLERFEVRVKCKKEAVRPIIGESRGRDDRGRR
jgi:RHS repeat-associated protein